MLLPCPKLESTVTLLLYLQVTTGWRLNTRFLERDPSCQGFHSKCAASPACPEAKGRDTVHHTCIVSQPLNPPVIFLSAIPQIAQTIAARRWKWNMSHEISLSNRLLFSTMCCIEEGHDLSSLPIEHRKRSRGFRWPSGKSPGVGVVVRISDALEQLTQLSQSPSPPLLPCDGAQPYGLGWTRWLLQMISTSNCPPPPQFNISGRFLFYWAKVSLSWFSLVGGRKVCNWAFALPWESKCIKSRTSNLRLRCSIWEAEDDSCKELYGKWEINWSSFLLQVVSFLSLIFST